MRDLIDIVTLQEKALTPAELGKHGGQYLTVLIELIGTGVPISVDPKYRNDLGDAVEIDASIVPELERALVDPENIKSALPKGLPLTNGTVIPFSALFKGPEFTGREGKKTYNTGHLAELFMGVAVFSKFANLGGNITVENLIDVIGNMQQGVVKQSYTFDLVRDISYPEPKAKIDKLTFRALVPGKSAQSFVNQLQSGDITQDLRNVMSSAVLFANSSETVQNACQRVREDLGSNDIQVVSDGSSDAKGTKADMVLKIDGQKINLLSLKTDSPTLGQFSGFEYENIFKFFNIGLGLDISMFQKYLDPTRYSKEILLAHLFDIYDSYVYPTAVRNVANNNPQHEENIVKRLATGANIFARGESLEDVDIVKLDDKVNTGNYKVMKYSDSLYEAMKELDLYVDYVRGKQSRTLKIMVRPAESKNKRQSNLLCQFRTQLMGGYPRNYFEVGDIMEDLVTIDQSFQQKQQVGVRVPARRSTNVGVGRERRK
jgi:hypothetical protein